MNIFDKDKTIKLLLILNFTLLVLYLLTNHIFTVPSYTVIHWFDFDDEYNIPAWFSSAQLFVIFILSIIYSKRLHEKYLKKAYILAGYTFLFFSVDETAMIHEGNKHIFEKMLIYSPFPNGNGIWIFIYFAIALVLAFVFGREVSAFLNEKIGRTVWIIGVCMFVIGGVASEIIGFSFDNGSLGKIIEISVEETLELLGQSLMIYALMSKLDSTNLSDRLL